MTHSFGELGAEAIRLLCGETRRVDVSVIRRSLDEAMLSWPGDERERWWKWLVETTRGMSYAARVIDASPREMFELARHGVTAVTLAHRDSPRLLVLSGTKRSKFRFFELPSNPRGHWVSQRQLSSLLDGAKASATQRWVVLEPVSDDIPLEADRTNAVAPRGDTAEVAHVAHAHPSPWARLREFLRPETSDLAIVLVFALFIGMLTLATPVAVEALVNTVAFGTLVQPLIVLSIILLTFLGFAASLRFLERFVVELIQRRLFARLVARLAWQFPRVDVSRTDLFAPELINRFFEIVTVQKMAAQLLLGGLTVVLTVGLGMIVLAFYHPWLLAFDVTLLILLGVNVFVFSRGAVRTSIEESRTKYSVAGWLECIPHCLLLFKAGGAAEFALTRADRLTTDYLMARQSHFRVLVRHIVSGLALEAFASAVLLGLGGLLVIQGQMTLGQLVAAELIVTLILAAVAKFDKHLEGYYDLVTSMDKIGYLFDLPVEPSSGAMPAGHTGAARLSLRQLSHDYGEGHVLFNGLTCDVSPGEIVTVTGPTGCGKSTLCDVLFRLREPSSGRMVLDDLDFMDLRLDVLRQHVALVRGMEVLEGTLAENVHLHRSEISTADVRAALHRAGLAELQGADSSPASDGQQFWGKSWNLHTVLNHQGRPLSENQLRRLQLARAFAGRPRLLLIDGVLDPLPEDESERLLNELKRTRADCTVVIATSQRAIAEQCDRVLKL